MPTNPPLSVHRPPLPPHWYETMSTFTQCTGGAEAYSVCMFEAKPPCSSLSEVKSSWPLIQLWLQVCSGPKTPHLCLPFLSAAPEAWRLEFATTPLVSSGQFGSVYSFSTLWATGGLSAWGYTGRKINQNHKLRDQHEEIGRKKKETLNDLKQFAVHFF